MGSRYVSSRLAVVGSPRTAKAPPTHPPEAPQLLPLLLPQPLDEPRHVLVLLRQPRHQLAREAHHAVDVRPHLGGAVGVLGYELAGQGRAEAGMGVRWGCGGLVINEEETCTRHACLFVCPTPHLLEGLVEALLLVGHLRLGQRPQLPHLLRRVAVPLAPIERRSVESQPINRPDQMIDPSPVAQPD